MEVKKKQMARSKGWFFPISKKKKTNKTNKNMCKHPRRKPAALCHFTLPTQWTVHCLRTCFAAFHKIVYRRHLIRLPSVQQVIDNILSRNSWVRLVGRSGKHKNVTVLFPVPLSLFPKDDLKRKKTKYGTNTHLPIFTVAADVRQTCKYFGRICGCDSNCRWESVS